MLRFFLRAILSRVSPFAVLLLLSTNASAVKYKILMNGNRYAFAPSSGLVTDAAGNAYGTTASGGHGNAETVYKLSGETGLPSLVYAFSGHDGRQPQGNLVFDSDGNLYGTTVLGGASNACGSNKGCGTVFKLTPSNGGLWTETVLYSFCSAANCTDGAYPQAGVILDSAGNLYGTTKSGGNQSCQGQGPGCGTVFQLQPSQSGWTESIAYAFIGGGTDGQSPLGSLVIDQAGSLYGTVQNPGPQLGGSVFQLTPSGGSWIFNLIYVFNGFSGSTDGSDPMAGLTFDGLGNLYGTTGGGGTFGFGTVFELKPNYGGWTESILYSFAGGNDGAQPESSLVFDSSGNLYGTTFAGGGTPCSCGTVFKLTPRAGGQWTETLFRFRSDGSQGYHPSAPVLLDADDNVYGTTTSGGQGNYGVVFRIGR